MGTAGTNCLQFALDGGVSWTTGLSGQKQGNSGANRNSPSHLVSRSHRPDCGIGQFGLWLGGVGWGQLSPESQCLLRAPVHEESLGLWARDGRHQSPPPAPARLPPTAGPRAQSVP